MYFIPRVAFKNNIKQKLNIYINYIFIFTGMNNNFLFFFLLLVRKIIN